MRFRLLIVMVLVVLGIGHPTKIRQLNDKNLQQFAKDNSYWFIQLSNGRCSECSAHESVLQEVGRSLDGLVKVGKIEAKLMPEVKVQKNPTYIFTRSDGIQKSAGYQGAFNARDIARFCLEQLSGFVKRRLDEHPSGSGSSGSSSSKNEGKGQSRKQPSSSSQSSKGSSTVIELNDKVFQQKVLSGDDAWLVQFYSPGCGHCRSFQPEYSKLPKIIGKRVHIARIDGSKNQQFMGKYQIKGFPTVLLFDTSDKSQPITYNGERTAEAVVDWLKGQNINQEKKEVYELTQSNYQQQCNKNIVCFIFILNKLSQKSKLRFLDDLLDEQNSKPFRFFVSERLLQFQSDLMIDDRDCPKMVSVWDSQNSYRIYNGPIEHESISEYLKNALERKRWIKYPNKLAQVLFPSHDL